MKIIKRNGAEVVFDLEKIVMAITKANNAAEENLKPQVDQLISDAPWLA